MPPDALPVARPEPARPHRNQLLGKEAEGQAATEKPLGCQSARLPLAMKTETLPGAGSPSKPENTADDQTPGREKPGFIVS